MKVLLYPGCMTALRYPGIEVSTKGLLRRLGHQVLQLDHLVCCGSCILESVSRVEWLSFASYTMAQAERLDCNLIVTTCGTCTSTLDKARSMLLSDGPSLTYVNGKLSRLGLRLSRPPMVLHVTELLYRDRRRMRWRAKRMGRAALQNPCNLIMTRRLPQGALAELAELMGFEVVGRSCASTCCGGSALATRREVFEKLAKKHLACFSGQGFDVVIVSCSTSYMAFVEMGFHRKVRYISDLALEALE